MQVQVLFPAPNQYNPNPFPIGDGFGFFVFFDRYESAYFRNGMKHNSISNLKGSVKTRMDKLSLNNRNTFGFLIAHFACECYN